MGVFQKTKVKRLSRPGATNLDEARVYEHFEKNGVVHSCMIAGSHRDPHVINACIFYTSQASVKLED
ncbi:hypothetical protein OLK001_17580 [Synechocystis sp. LKSZ1]